MGQSPKSTKRVAETDIAIMRAVGTSSESFIVGKGTNKAGTSTVYGWECFIAFNLNKAYARGPSDSRFMVNMEVSGRQSTGE